MRSLTCFVLLTIFSIAGVCQTQQASTTAVPNLITYSGTLQMPSGAESAGKVVGVTFAIYRQEDGGAPVWMETQNVTLDSAGHYSVLLGSTKGTGIPADIFNTQEQRWLGVQLQGEAEQPRVLLVSVPYAMKAGDAETIGGLPASAFVLASPPNSTSVGGASASAGSNRLATGTAPRPLATGTTPVTTAGGTVNQLAKFDASADITNSIIFDNGTNVGIGTTSPSAKLGVNGSVSATGFNIGSNRFAFGSFLYANSFLGFAGNSTTTGPDNTATGYGALYNNTTGSNNTATGVVALVSNTTGTGNTASGVQALYANTTGSNNTATGLLALDFNTIGSYNTATGYHSLLRNTTGAFNTATGADALFSNSGNYNTATGVEALYANTTGSSNTADGHQALYSNTTGTYNTASGDGALFHNTTGGGNTATGTSALVDNTTGYANTADGLQALLSNTTGYNNTASGFDALFSNTTGHDNTADGFQALWTNTTGNDNVAIGYSALYGATGTQTGSDNTAVGDFAMYLNQTGYQNTVTGFQALQSNTTGYNNTAVGTQALQGNGSGWDNTAVGIIALQDNTSGNLNTAVGVGAFHTNQTGSNLTCVGAWCGAAAAGLTNATAIGAYATVGQSNSLVLGGTGEHGVNVGIGTTTPSNIFTIGRGLGHPVSDSWETYSSRRWKTNIHTLQGALTKVEQLRGVSYSLKDSGKPEIGVIAEEVGAVVPEVVSWEKDGTDAQGVDYGRLTALLIEATKEQQALIHKQQEQIRAQEAQIKAQQTQSVLQQAQIAQLTSQVRAIQASINTNGRIGADVRSVKAQTAVAQQ